MQEGSGDDRGRARTRAERRRAERAASRARRTGRVILRTLVALLSVAVLGGAGAGWATLGKLSEDLRTTDVLSAPPAVGDGVTDILLVGSDSRTDARGNPLPLPVLKQLRTERSAGLNTDTIILVRVPDDGGAAHAMSIPRDTFVELPGRGHDKINAVYGDAKSEAAERLRKAGMRDRAEVQRASDRAGQRVLVRTVELLTGVRVDRYAEVNLYGFYLLTEAIGGVEVCLNSPTTDPGSGADFPAGRQTISGGDALSFVRQRGGLPHGDLDRIVRQQVFLAAVANKVLSTGTLTDPSRLTALIDAAQRSVILDADWDVLGFARQMQGIAAGAVEFVTMPVTSTTARTRDGQSIVTVDRDQVQAFVRGLPEATPPPLPAAAPPPAAPLPALTAVPGSTGVNVDVLNGNGVDGLARRVSQQLAEAGFALGEVGNTAAQGTSFVLAAPSAADDAQRVADELGGLPVEADPSLDSEQVLVLLGTDYAGPGSEEGAAAGAEGADQLRGSELLRVDAATLSPAPPAQPTPPGDGETITADGVPCVN